MTHTPSAKTTIYFSKDYRQFKFLPGNRAINEAKVRKIIADIEDGLNMLPYCPIVVNKSLQIIDGQHRFTAAKALREPVFYVIADDKTMGQVARINSRAANWKPLDYVRCYAESGNIHYRQVLELVNDYNIPVSSAAMILHDGYSQKKWGGRTSQAFKEGTFVAGFPQEARKILDLAMRFEGYEGYGSGKFLRALGTLIHACKCDFDRLIEKYLSNTDMLPLAGSEKQFLYALELLYNKGKSKREAIY